MNDAHADAGRRPAASASAAGASAPTRGGWRAWAELLRAPLLLSPVADVLAGWTLGMLAVARHGPESPFATDADAWRAARESLPALGLAALTGVCLLAAGMAQNAFADRHDDARRKPDRPLPRGALSAGAVCATMLLLTAAAITSAAMTGTRSVALCGAIILLTAAYHVFLKPFRLPGCLALGALRGLDVLLGTAAVAAAAEPWRSALDGSPDHAVDFTLPCVVGIFYALFMTGASMHASTDDAPPGRNERRWSHAGLALNALVLLLLPWDVQPVFFGAIGGPTAVAATHLLLPLVVLWAMGRLVLGWRTLPPGPLTGVALSGLYLFGAIVCLRYDVSGLGLVAAMLGLALFGASRLMRRAFPPT